MLLPAVRRPLVASPLSAQVTGADAGLERPPSESKRAKPVVAWNALDVAGEARRKLARRGYDWD